MTRRRRTRDRGSPAAWSASCRASSITRSTSCVRRGSRDVRQARPGSGTGARVPAAASPASLHQTAFGGCRGAQFSCAASWRRHRRLVRLGETFLAVIGEASRRLRDLAKDSASVPSSPAASRHASTSRRRAGDCPSDRTEHSGAPSVDLQALARVHGHADARRSGRSTRSTNTTAATADESRMTSTSSTRTRPIPSRRCCNVCTVGASAPRSSPHTSCGSRLRLGVPGERIIYNGPAKSAAIDPNGDRTRPASDQRQLGDRGRR